MYNFVIITDIYSKYTTLRGPRDTQSGAVLLGCYCLTLKSLDTLREDEKIDSYTKVFFKLSGLSI